MALTFGLQIDCSGPAFFRNGDQAGGTNEVPRILRDVADTIEGSDVFKGTITASDGTTVGSWSFRNDG